MTKDGLRVKYDDMSLELYTTESRALENGLVSCLSMEFPELSIDNSDTVGVDKTGLYVGTFDVTIDLLGSEIDRDVSARTDRSERRNACANMRIRPKTMALKC